MQKYTATQISTELFFKFPKFLLQNKNYTDLSNDSKLLYMILKDRYQYSLSSGWVDEDQNVFIYYSTEELKEVLNIGINKVTRLKRELIKAGLLEVVKQGFNTKTQKNYPDRLYLLQPDYKPTDLISQSSHAKTHVQSGFTKTVISKESHEIKEEPSKVSSEKCNKPASALEPCDITKTVTYQDKNNLDTIKDTTTDTWNFDESNFLKEIVQKQNQDIVKHIDRVLTNDTIPMFLSSESLQIISMWFNTPQQIHECISTILNAANDSKAEAIEQTGKHELNFEDYNNELKVAVTDKLRRYFNRMRTAKNGEIRDPKGYLYTSMRNLFDSWQNKIMMDNED